MGMVDREPTKLNLDEMKKWYLLVWKAAQREFPQDFLYTRCIFLNR